MNTSNLLSNRIKSMAVSATLAMATKARELKAQGIEIIGLSLGEPDFEPLPFVKEAAKKAIDGDYHSYSPVDGYLALKEAVVKKFKRDNNLDYTTDSVVVSTGAKQSLANLALALLNPKDEVILPAPYWVSYSEIVKLAEATPVEIPTSIAQDFKITPKQLSNAINENTKMIWFSSPCNPSGSVYSRSELEALAEVIKKHPKIIVVSDEIYEHINFTDSKHCSIASIDGMFDKTVTVNGVSKAFAMTGWRIGYIGAPRWIAKATNKIQGQVTSGANTIAQMATITVLEADVSEIDYMITTFRERRDLVIRGLSKIPGFKVNNPDGAFYVFPDISAFFNKTIQGRCIENASDFALFLLEKARVATVSGEAFGNPNCIRISYAASEEQLKKALRQIEEAINKG